jgi:tetratricopeptide (TPR) repeat protein
VKAAPSNPYDYSGRAGADLFIGRRAELGRLDAFCASIAAGNTAHILLHGARGLGKSTLLVRAEEKLAGAGIIFAKLTLDEGSATEREFFLEALLTLQLAVVAAGGFGGPDGEFASQLYAALAGQLPSRGQEGGPLRVRAYANAMQAGRIPDALLKADLEELLDEARDLGSAGLVLMLDEANQLVGNPETVQRLRNLLLVPSLLSVIAAGTDDALAAFDSAGVPAARHFQLMSIRPLGDVSETLDCLSKPLAAVGLLPPQVIPPSLAEEIHALSGGSPYEVLLLGHLMYERYLANDDETLELNEEVLEDAIRNLRASSEDEGALAIVRSLTEDQLRDAASYLIDPRPSMTEHAMLLTAFDDPTPDAISAARERVRAAWDQLAAVGLARVEGELLRPTVGEIARLYVKYHARVSDLLPERVEGEFESRLADGWLGRVRDAITSVPEVVQIRIFARGGTVLEAGRFSELVEDFALVRDGQFDSLASRMSIVTAISTLTQEEGNKGPSALLALHYEIRENGFVAIVLVDTDPEHADVLAGVLAAVDDAGVVPGAYRLRLGFVDGLSLAPGAWGSLATAFGDFATRLAVLTQFRTRERAQALSFAKRALASLEERTKDGEGVASHSRLWLLNAVGFMELASGHLVDALELFERCAAAGGLAGKDRDDNFVLMANLSAAAAGLGRYPEAIGWLDQIIANAPDDLVLHGWLSVFGPDPSWVHQPTLVEDPHIKTIGLLSKAGVLSRQGDHGGAVDHGERALATWPRPWVQRTFSEILRAANYVDRADEVLREANELEADEPFN